MDEYKNILIGTNSFCIDWKIALYKLNKKNIIIFAFDNFHKLQNVIINKNIQYIIPMSKKDYDLIKYHKFVLNNNAKILHPTDDIFTLLDNKNIFTEYMLNKYPNNIPDVYFLNNVKLKDISYPAIYKPMHSTNGSHMIIIHNDHDFAKLRNKNNIQKFIDNEYEYGAHMVCMDGVIINWKIIRFKYGKYNIKKTNFPKNYENVDDFDISVFRSIMNDLNYSGCACIDFKYDNGLLYIFEINPRFGGSVFACDFVYELLCIK